MNENPNPAHPAEPAASGLRTPYIAGNWKLWGTRAQAADYCERLLTLLSQPEAAGSAGRAGNGISARRRPEVGLCVPYTALETVSSALQGSGVIVAAQNMHQAESGAYTGEISAPMLLEVGATAVVLGHSERRQLSGETDRALSEKVPAALEAGLQPILCVGETEEEREAGDMERKLRHQVQEGLEQVADDRLADIVIAYEPIWAIGTGKVATPDQAQEATSFVRALVGDRSEDAAERVRVLYGGSVKPDNAGEILEQADIDGALVGGASLDPDSFARIVAAAG